MALEVIIEQNRRDNTVLHIWLEQEMFRHARAGVKNGFFSHNEVEEFIDTLRLHRSAFFNGCKFAYKEVRGK